MWLQCLQPWVLGGRGCVKLTLAQAGARLRFIMLVGPGACCLCVEGGEGCGQGTAPSVGSDLTAPCQVCWRVSHKLTCVWHEVRTRHICAGIHRTLHTHAGCVGWSVLVWCVAGMRCGAYIERDRVRRYNTPEAAAIAADDDTNWLRCRHSCSQHGLQGAWVPAGLIRSWWFRAFGCLDGTNTAVHCCFELALQLGTDTLLSWRPVTDT